MKTLTQNTAKILEENYGRTSDEEILLLAKKIIPIFKIEGSFYFPCDTALDDIQKGGRKVAFTWNRKKGKTITSLKRLRTMNILIKSSSPMLFKPDIGEVFDQFSEKDKEQCKYFWLDMGSVPPVGSGPGRNEFIVECTIYSQ